MKIVKMLELFRLVSHNVGFICAFIGGYLIAVAIAEKFNSLLTWMFVLYFVFMCLLSALVIVEDILYLTTITKRKPKG